VPVLQDHRAQLEPLDQDPDLVVGGEVHRAEESPPAALDQPPLGGTEQSRRHLRVVDRLEEAEHPVVSPLDLVPAAIDLGGDAPDRLAAALGEEVLGLAVLEPGVLASIEELHPLVDQRRHPLRAIAVETERGPRRSASARAGSGRGGFRRLPREGEPTLRP
jgi:hypothetical protein